MKTSETLRGVLERYQIGLKQSVEMILDLVEKGHYEAASSQALRVRGALDAHQDYLLERIGHAEQHVIVPAEKVADQQTKKKPMPTPEAGPV